VQLSAAGCKVRSMELLSASNQLPQTECCFIFFRSLQTRCMSVTGSNSGGMETALPHGHVCFFTIMMGIWSWGPWLAVMFESAGHDGLSVCSQRRDAV
jgi:hypothetical protein